jgi:alkyl sulfatase BDS1-like metallo-beta-lactamase superfamily hydrolase
MRMKDFGFDPQRALDQFRRLASSAPGQLADGLGKLVRDASPERLEQLMRSPARRPLLDGIFWQMPKQLDAARAAGVRSSVRWRITGRADDGADTYDLLLIDGHARTVRGGDGQQPRLTITVDGVEFLRLVSGNSDPMKAYFTGRIQIEGDIMVAAKLAALFRMPGPRQDPDGNGNGSGNPGGNGNPGGKGSG